MLSFSLSFFKGYYLYVESSSLSRGQEARLVSPNLPAQREGQCLKFYYSMYGSTMGTLKVQIKKSNGNSWLIFYKSGNQGTGWKRASGNINVGAGFNYQVSEQAFQVLPQGTKAQKRWNLGILSERKSRTHGLKMRKRRRLKKMTAKDFQSNRSQFCASFTSFICYFFCSLLCLSERSARHWVSWKSIPVC